MNAVERFHAANAIRECVRAAVSATVATDKLDAAREWLAWAASWAERLVPLGDLEQEARVVAPDPAAMSEAEFKYWYHWPDSAKRVSAGYRRGFEPCGV